MKAQEEELKHALQELVLGSDLDLLVRVEERCALLEERVGDDASLSQTLRGVVVDVLREAGVKDYDRLANVLAPVVVASIRNEIKNSRDMMVDALYPITGQLVAAAVRNAFRELLETLNERLDQSISADRWKARIKAKVTGRSEAEILLQQNPPLHIDELLVIHRHTGLLIIRVGGEEAEEGADRELVSGMIAAIMSFSRDAFGDQQSGELESITFGDSRLFLRTSPTIILAVRAGGMLPRRFEVALDQLFQEVLGQWGPILSGFDGHLEPDEGAALKSDLQSRFASLLEESENKSRPKSKKALIVIAAIAACLILWIAYEGIVGWRGSRIENTARGIVEQQASLPGHPVSVRFDRSREMLLIEGLVPLEFSQERLRADLEQNLSGVALSTRLAIPGQEVIERTQDLESGMTSLSSVIEASIDGLNTRVMQLAETYETQTSKQLVDLDMRNRELIDITNGISRSTDEMTEALRAEVATLKERLSTLEAARSSVEYLKVWAKGNAVFFSDLNSLQNPKNAHRKLSELVTLIASTPPSISILLVGYSDFSGDVKNNRQISQSRAEFVFQELDKLGAPQGRLIAVGRASEKLMSPRAGTNSENRRVEFEIIQNSDAVN